MVPDELPRDLPSFLAGSGPTPSAGPICSRQRWPQGFCCQGCGHGAAYQHRRRLIEECAACGKQHSLLAGHDLRADQDRPGALVSGDLAGDLEQGRHLGGGAAAADGLRQLPDRLVLAAQDPQGDGPAGPPAARRSGSRPTRPASAGRPGRPGRGAAGKTVVAGAVEAGRGKGRSAGSAGCGSQAWPTPARSRLLAATWPSRPPWRTDGWPATAVCRPRLPPRAINLSASGATPCCACRPSTWSSASPSAGCSAPITARQQKHCRLPRRVRLPLVWGFGCQALNVGIEFLPVSSSSRWRQPSRGLAHDVPRGARPLARIIAPQACIRWTRGDPDHDAAMRIGGEAPGRRAHSSMRHESHRKARVTATSDRHRQPAGEPWAGRETVSGAPLRPSPLTPPDAGRHRPASRRWSPNATAR